jgi:hypothetical protein
MGRDSLAARGADERESSPVPAYAYRKPINSFLLCGVIALQLGHFRADFRAGPPERIEFASSA